MPAHQSVQRDLQGDRRTGYSVGRLLERQTAMRAAIITALVLWGSAGLRCSELPKGLTQQSRFFEGESAEVPGDGSQGRGDMSQPARHSGGGRLILGAGGPAEYTLWLRRSGRHKVWLRLEALRGAEAALPVVVRQQGEIKAQGELRARPGGLQWTSLESRLERGYALVQVGPTKQRGTVALDCGLVTPFLSYQPNHEDFLLPESRAERLETALTQVFVYGYVAVAMLYLLFFFLRQASVGALATGLLVIALAGNVGAIAVRTWRGGRLPLSSGWDFALCFTAGAAAAYLIVERVQKSKLLGAAAAPIICGLALYGYTVFEDKGVHGLMPALRNPFWLTAHVLMAIVAYGGLAVSCGVSGVHLLRLWGDARATDGGLPGLLKRQLPSAEFLDQANYKIIGFSFPFLTLLIITGAVWAQTAWGRWWGWDPKETSSLVAWLIYAAYLHARLLANWKGARASWIALLGFVAIIICYVGVNYLPGLHSYGAPG